MNGGNDMYYGGSALRDLVAETDGVARAAAAVSIVALGLGVAALCYFAFKSARTKGVPR